MGDLMKAISDDIDDYEYLCNLYKENIVEVYSDHYYWLKLMHNKETTLTYQEYKKEREKCTLENQIKEAEKNLANLKNKR